MNIYPIRAVRDQRFKYIRNIRFDGYHTTHTDIQRRPGHGAFFDEWEAAAVTDPHARAVLQKYHRRPAVEFYDIGKDPGETTNLIKDEKHTATIAKLRKELDLRIAESHPGGKDKMPMDEGIKGELPDEKIR